MAFDMFLNTEEAAQYLGYSVDAIRKSRVTGRLGGSAAPIHIKKGYRVEYAKAELLEWQSRGVKKHSTTLNIKGE